MSQSTMYSYYFLVLLDSSTGLWAYSGFYVQCLYPEDLTHWCNEWHTLIVQNEFLKEAVNLYWWRLVTGIVAETVWVGFSWYLYIMISEWSLNFWIYRCKKQIYYECLIINFGARMGFYNTLLSIELINTTLYIGNLKQFPSLPL